MPKDDGDEADGSPTAIPTLLSAIKTLTIENSRIDLTTPAGLLSLPFRAKLTTRDEAMQIDLDVPMATLNTQDLSLIHI